MLCPEIWNFPPPKTILSIKKINSFEDITSIIKLNNFYRSAVITCIDEIQTPESIKEILEDNDFYKLKDCSLTEFLSPVFIKSFIKGGRLFCLSADRNCIVQNCVCITPDGVLILHVLEFIYQTIGLEGTKLPHNFYQIKIDLHNLQNIAKTKNALEKLEEMDYYMSWEPENDNVCPSSIAKYFFDRNISITSQNLEITPLTPSIRQIPTMVDAEIDEIVEWVGMLACDADVAPSESYISSYSEPDCTAPIKSNRISLLIIKGFLTPTLLTKLSCAMIDYVKIRELEDYWACLSVQSIEDSLWRWNKSSPSTFQSHNNSCNYFYTNKEHIVYSIGQLKFS